MIVPGVPTLLAPAITTGAPRQTFRKDSRGWLGFFQLCLLTGDICLCINQWVLPDQTDFLQQTA